MDDNEDKIVITILLPLMALMAPFLVWPIEFYLPYPYIIEELVKVIFVLFIIKESKISKQIQLGLIIGVLFALSETVFYLFNFFQQTSLLPLILRLFLTSILHSLTIMVILISTFVNKKLLVFGLLFAILIHYLYNFYI